MDSLHQVHLDWMFENEPSLVLQLDQQGKLFQRLQRVRDQANRVELAALEAGWPPDEAREMMLAILAPSDGPAIMQDPAPVPVPYEEQERIWDRLERQENQRTP